MKKTNLILLLPAVAAIGFCGCLNQNQEVPGKNKTKAAKSLIDGKYIGTKALARLINMPTYSLMEDSFELKEEQDVQVYGVGEILYNLSEYEKRYYLESDDIELFFDGDIPDVGRKGYVFSFGDKSAYKNQGIEFNGKKLNFGYTAEIKLPWKALGIAKVCDNLRIHFDMAVGDNDDGFIQKSKIAWSGDSDNMFNTSRAYGWLVLKNGCSVQHGDSLFYSAKATINVDTVIDQFWSKVPPCPIRKVVHGFVKDKYDLSAVAKSCWDDENIYFLLEIKDSRQKAITSKKIKERGIFTDYGWIENEQGEKIWEMNAKYSHYAGGALRNQFVDTVIHLHAGRYKIKYTSDESHSYNDWVDDPPETPFYGIMIYRKK